MLSATRTRNCSVTNTRYPTNTQNGISDKIRLKDRSREIYNLHGLLHNYRASLGEAPDSHDTQSESSHNINYAELSFSRAHSTYTPPSKNKDDSTVYAEIVHKESIIGDNFSQGKQISKNSSFTSEDPNLPAYKKGQDSRRLTPAVALSSLLTLITGIVKHIPSRLPAGPKNSPETETHVTGAGMKHQPYYTQQGYKNYADYVSAGRTEPNGRELSSRNSERTASSKSASFHDHQYVAAINQLQTTIKNRLNDSGLTKEHSVSFLQTPRSTDDVELGRIYKIKTSAGVKQFARV